ncbi:MAG TPA: 4-(cytidine 5'-diphospho)-2-C-methyl-D-erythritol kinase [Puia sp.]|jgi:4-diphosphocytidyl-2-C-methyl-D-erythritol kinase|nr:4-(cytidine 5'-diphospho)-2-C-methyl-D-erythritol kinase [Puia sp.]
MLTFPNCKINLGLNIIGRRADGYHNIETVFYPIQINDVLEIVPADEFKFSISGLVVDGNANDNLCVKAYSLLKKNFPQLPAVNILLHKAIPTGAGLGGGSADGAFTLILLNEKLQLNLSTAQLIGYALQLGSDCPFFIINKPCFASGRGEILEPLEIDLSKYSFLLVHPNIHINTAWAFSQLNISDKNFSIKEIIAQPISSWEEKLQNDFEGPVFNKYPELKMIKEKLYDAGALYASMTGSGSSIFGIFEKNNIPSISFEKNFSIFIIK